MQLTADHDWLVGVRRVPSPNCDARPPDASIDLLVIHAISLPPGVYSGDCIDRFFTNSLPADEHPYFADICGMRVSAHALIRRDGSITQYVPFSWRAWHAGASCFEGRERCNDFSIGIELEGSEDEAFTDAQYAALATVARVLMHAWPAITPARVVGHADIAPGRKTDPGPNFDWERLSALLKRHETATANIGNQIPA